MRDFVTPKTIKDELVKSNDKLYEQMQQMHDIYEKVGAIKERARILKICALYMGEHDNEESERKLQLILQLMQRIQAKED